MIGSIMQNNNFYTVRDVRSLHTELMSEHYRSTLSWLQRVYPAFISMQVTVALIIMFMFGTEWFYLKEVEGFTQVSICSLLSVLWPLLLAPINRDKTPTLAESEMLLCVRYLRENEAIMDSELVERLKAHRRVIHQQMANLVLLRQQHFLAWVFYRINL